MPGLTTGGGGDGIYVNYDESGPHWTRVWKWIDGRWRVLESNVECLRIMDDAEEMSQ